MKRMEWIFPILKTTPFRWESLAGALPVELAGQPPVPGEWSAVECLQHLIDTERWVFPARVEAFLAGQDFPAFNPDQQGSRPGEQPFPEMAAEFTRLRQDSLAKLAQVQAPDLERKVRHAELGIVSLDEMLNEWAAHDLMHTVQAERALMQTYIRRCGPWQVYFADHVAKQGS